MQTAIISSMTGIGALFLRPYGRPVIESLCQQLVNRIASEALKQRVQPFMNSSAGVGYFAAGAFIGALTCKVKVKADQFFNDRIPTKWKASGTIKVLTSAISYLAGSAAAGGVVGLPMLYASREAAAMVGVALTAHLLYSSVIRCISITFPPKQNERDPLVPQSTKPLQDRNDVKPLPRSEKKTEILFSREDYLELAKSYMKAAEEYAKDSNCKEDVIRCYLNAGESFFSTPEDLKGCDRSVEGRQAYEKAAKLGSPYGMKELAFCFKIGKGGTKDLAESQRLYLQAAEKFKAVSNEKEMLDCYLECDKPTNEIRLKIAKSYEENVGNLSEAVKWYVEAAESGCVESQQKLLTLVKTPLNDLSPQSSEQIARYYQSPSLYESRDVALAAKYYMNAAAGYEKQSKWSAAYGCYDKASKCGDKDAMYRVGLCFEEGLGVCKNEVEALECYYLAAEQNQIDAQNKIKKLIDQLQGEGQNQNKGLVFELLAKKALKERQEADIFKTIGDYYKNAAEAYLSIGDEESALRCYKLAWEKTENRDSLVILAQQYEKGSGSKINRAQAIRLYAEAGKSPNQKQARKKLEATKDEIQKSPGNATGNELYQIAFSIQYGHGLQVNLLEAIEFYKWAAQAFEKERDGFMMALTYGGLSRCGDGEAGVKAGDLYNEAKFPGLARCRSKALEYYYQAYLNKDINVQKKIESLESEIDKDPNSIAYEFFVSGLHYDDLYRTDNKNEGLKKKAISYYIRTAKLSELDQKSLTTYASRISKLVSSKELSDMAGDTQYSLDFRFSLYSVCCSHGSSPECLKEFETLAKEEKQFENWLTAQDEKTKSALKQIEGWDRNGPVYKMLNRTQTSPQKED